MISAARLIQARPQANPVWLTALVDQMPKFGIVGPVVESAFLGQIHHECMGFTKFEESLYYKDPTRIAQIFRRAFDLNSNKQIDDAEIDFAKQFVRQPEKLANRAYAGKLGNGDEASGDGWKYRGRGPIQTTFRDNYEKASFWASVNLVLSPDEMLVPRNGSAAACGYFRDTGCISLANVGDQREITRRINPGLAGLDERIQLVSEYRSILEAP